VQEKDKYGRLLAYVFTDVYCDGGNIGSIAFHGQYVLHVAPHTQEIQINEAIVRAGYASPMTIPPNVTAKQSPTQTEGKYADLFQELYEEAREQGRGLWTNLASEKPRLTNTEVIEIALKYWEVDGKFLVDKTEKEAKYDREKGMWSVSFDSAIKRPGSRFFIIVNDTTGEVDRIIHGR